MTNRMLCKKLGLKVFNQGSEKEIETGYCGDLLSWVMGRAPTDCAWITVMNNSNVAAVALLRDAACVILSQGAEPDKALLEKAVQSDVSIYGTQDDSYVCAVKVGNLI